MGFFDRVPRSDWLAACEARDQALESRDRALDACRWIQQLCDVLQSNNAGLQLKINLLEQQVKELQREAVLLRIGQPAPMPAAGSTNRVQGAFGCTIVPDTYPRGGISVPGAENLDWPTIDAHNLPGAAAGDIDPRFAEAHFQNDLFPHG